MKRIYSSILVFLLLIFICLSQSASSVSATGESITGDYFNKVFDIKLNNGKTFLDTQKDVEFREEINNKIFDGTATENYSLYDRFGGDISFIPYFGETKITVGLVDYFYSKYASGEDFELSEEELKDLFDNIVVSNNVIYNGRPDVLSAEQLQTGYIDPRVYAYNAVSITGGDAALGNTLLKTSNFFTTLIGYFSGSGLYTNLDEIWTQMMSNGVEDLVKSIAVVILPFAVSIFVILLISKSIQILKGKESGRKVLLNFLSILVSLGLAFTLIMNPVATSNIITKVISLFDTILDTAIEDDENEVIASSNLQNIRVATLWNKVVFEPWCEGMFGQKYSNLYTQYDTSGNPKMEQSNDDITNEWTDGSLKYNSAVITGDIKIPIGNNEYVRNWGALAWSTQSIYHIDAATSSEQEVVEKYWPKATTTPLNDNIYIDNFRWIDAKLNISPEYHSTDLVVQNFSDSNYYEHNFTSSGLHSFYLMLLLIPIGILTVRKLVCSVKVVTSGVQLCYSSILNLVMPDKYDVVNNLKKIAKNIYDLFWWSIIIFLGISIYSNMINNSLIGDFLWLLIGIYLCKFKPIRTSSQVRQIAASIKKGAKNAVNKIKNIRANKK